MGVDRRGGLEVAYRELDSIWAAERGGQWIPVRTLFFDKTMGFVGAADASGGSRICGTC
jgi:hypothetical protein